MCIRDRETATYIAYYIISQQAATSGSIMNTATATASSPGNSNNVTDGDTANVSVSPQPSLRVVKTASVSDQNSSGKNDVGDIITYTIVVSNTGNLPLSNLSLVDALTDGNAGVLSLDSTPGLTSTSVGSSSGTLLVGGRLTYTATYTIQQASAYTGNIINRATVTASSPGNSLSLIHI